MHDYIEFTCLLLLAIVTLAIAASIIVYILRNPFRYPYFEEYFDVSGKRNVRIDDYIDRFLADSTNWSRIVSHNAYIQRWKQESERYLQKCRLRKRRKRQYAEVIDDSGAYRFITQRNQTRYKQRNFVKTSYKVSVPDSEASVSWEWLTNRRNQLASIGYETTLRDYRVKNQRKLMTKSLREQIAQRDNYTCQMCGRYMPDGFGLHIDHIVPIAKGGKTVPSNLQVLCSKCNGRKGAR